jgi:hypothetical protein
MEKPKPDPEEKIVAISHENRALHNLKLSETNA